jgi:hypothetical protein
VEAAWLQSRQIRCLPGYPWLTVATAALTSCATAGRPLLPTLDPPVKQLPLDVTCVLVWLGARACCPPQPGAARGPTASYYLPLRLWAKSKLTTRCLAQTRLVDVASQDTCVSLPVPCTVEACRLRYNTMIVYTESATTASLPSVMADAEPGSL